MPIDPKYGKWRGSTQKSIWSNDHLFFVMLNLYKIDTEIDKYDANFII